MATQPAGPSIASAQAGLVKEGGALPGRKRRGSAKQRSETLAAYLFLTPYLFVLCLFFFFVSLYGIGLSFFRIDLGFGAATFVGFKNYIQLFNQLANPGLSDFWTSMWNILKFTVCVVIGQTILALLLALLLQTIKTGKSAFRTMFYVPAVTSSVATSLIFLWLYNPNGLINYVLSLAGIHGPDWLNNVFWALPALMLLNIWSTAATFMIYFLAALQDLPTDVLEAAQVDGAGPWQSFSLITVPLLRPTIFLVVALGTIGAFQMFDQAKFMTNGQPLNSTLTPMLEIYNEAFNNGGFGQASAMSVILFLIIFVITILQRRMIDPGAQR
ncbi:carbohydrate ABC transporter permease [Dictyobacter arantiisoli]|uniref:Sugar ABC transporter permease n=1 Tax=Dictyobacter arantiisoli TaxID=2014874 RepID=A0A5A5T919_9CHLR|nr:sugar ABC transporter permease [Dictyobacter arantiisoli]GCF07533.1 sugar ABC transporter permease [Dictyobacter arantiisoli]